MPRRSCKKIVPKIFEETVMIIIQLFNIPGLCIYMQHFIYPDAVMSVIGVNTYRTQKNAVMLSGIPARNTRGYAYRSSASASAIITAGCLAVCCTPSAI
jgi:hypothetical protein